MSKKDILSYHEKYENIPKDYMERLAYLYRLKPYKKEHLNSLLQKIDALKNVEWDSVSYIFYMEPKSAPRPRMNRNTFTFYVKDAKNFKKVFDDFKEAHSDLDYVISTPCETITKSYIETPKSMSLEETMAAELELIHHVNSPDYDNIAKRYTDMVQTTLISNDSIIFKGTSEKFYSILPRVEVTVKFMKLYDCKYNRRTIEKRKSFYENPLTVKDLGHII